MAMTAKTFPPASFLSPLLQGLEPYTPGEQPRLPDLVKLNTNENPYPPSPQVVTAIEAAAAKGLQRYPDPSSALLREAVAAHHGLQADQVFVGNGSDEVLAHAFFAFFQHAQPLVLPDVTYSFYKVYCQLYGITPHLVPLGENLRVDMPAMLAAAQQGCAGVVLANPNAPTGVPLPLDAIEALAQACPERVFLVDEAYVDFGADSAVGLINCYPNILVVHTLSKSRSLAGLRVGLAMGQRHLIDALERIKDSFNSYPLDSLAQAGAVASYQDRAYFEQTCKAVIQSRTGLALHLEDLGFEVLPSATNFLFVRHPAHDAGQLASALRAKSIVVRHFAKPQRIAQYLRITVGTPGQCSLLVDTLKDILA